MTQPKQQSKAMVKAGFADGHVIHHRVKPKLHRFKYQMCWCVFDLDKLGDWFSHSKLWAHNSWSIFGLYDQDYVSDEKQSIKNKLQQFINSKTQQQFKGRILLFTHPRFLGYGFNSVNFYFCYQAHEDGDLLSYIVTEINNTPWGEKFLYLHDCAEAKNIKGSLSFEFEKQFHISPFVQMEMNYRWDFSISAEQIAVKMWVKQQADTILTVVLDTKITPLMENNLNGFIFKKPFQPWKMSLGIYWQAFKLWCKRVTFYDHPKSKNNK
jgi:DUF1365 family protein